MKAVTLQREIIKRGGKADIITEHIKSPATGKEWDRHTLRGTLKSFDIEMHLDNGTQFNGGNDYFTTRRISNRNTYDQGSDYNPGGYEFHHRIKELDWILER